MYKGKNLLEESTRKVKVKCRKPSQQAWLSTLQYALCALTHLGMAMLEFLMDF